MNCVARYSPFIASLLVCHEITEPYAPYFLYVGILALLKDKEFTHAGLMYLYIGHWNKYPFWMSVAHWIYVFKQNFSFKITIQ